MESSIDLRLDLYPRLGWPGLACRYRGKEPSPQHAPHGCHSSTCDREAIAAILDSAPSCNWGVATGTSSRMWVLDIDARNGGHQALEHLVDEHGPLPPAPEAATGGGGRHLVFAMPADGRDVPCRTNLMPGIDVKGTGGYIVAEPSIHPNGQPYLWLVDAHPSEVAPAQAPEWLLDLVTTTCVTRTDFSKVIAEGVTDGQRNTTLASVAGYLFRRLDPLIAAELAESWAQTHLRPHLPESEVQRVICSIGMRELRKRGMME